MARNAELDRIRERAELQEANREAARRRAAIRENNRRRK